MELISGFRYRPEIDGLRAVAVLAVLLFHCGLGVPGGFVGVDVFFVISGYLITSLILKDLQRGTFSLAAFWERRIRRILPASAVLVLVVLATGAFLLMPSDYRRLGWSAVCQAACAANVFFWRNTSYFSPAADEQPLLHMWSLAVEEQFYLLFPFALVLLSRIPAVWTRRGLAMVFSVGIAASLALSIWAVRRYPPAAFYLLPTRAWELLLGSLIAVLRPAAQGSVAGLVGSWSGLVAILVPCFVYDAKTPFPGLAALPPCLGAAAFIWGSPSVSRPSILGLPARLLESRPAVFIGLISYSLYLWHWPLLAFSHYWTLAPWSMAQRLLLVAFSLILAILSWRHVESPFRRGSEGVRRPRVFVAAAVTLAVIAILAGAITACGGFPARLPANVVAFDDVMLEHTRGLWIRQKTNKLLDDAEHGRFPRIGAPEPAPLRMLLWGDSHAEALAPELDRLGRELGVGIAVATYFAMAPVLDYPMPPSHELGPRAPRFNAAVLRFVEENRISTVLIACRWHVRILDGRVPGGTDESHNRFVIALGKTVDALAASGCRPFLFQEAPNHPASVPKALAAHELFGVPLDQFRSSAADIRKRDTLARPALESMTSRGAALVNPLPLCLDAESGLYVIAMGGKALFSDTNHLSDAGARLLGPVLREVVQSARDGNSASSGDPGSTNAAPMQRGVTTEALP